MHQKVTENYSDDFSRLLSRKSCLLKTEERFIFAENSKMFSKSIGFQPCVTKFFTWDIVSTRLADIPEKEYILETLRKTFFTPEQLAEAEAQVSMNYFTRKGLEYFADTGITVNLPGQLLKPLSESERLYILTSLKNDIGKHFKMLN